MISPDAAGRIEIPAALNPERQPMNRLVENGLLRRVDVNQKQRGGRRGNRELFYFLSDARAGEAVVAAGEQVGVSRAKKARNDYMRGGLKGRHTKLRNDYLIRLMLDAQSAGVDVPLEEMWGESCPDYPILGERITHDAAGRELDEFERRKAGYEEVLPDGRFLVEWGGGLACMFDLELELNSESKVLAEKVSTRAAAFSRMYSDAEDRERAWWVRESSRLLKEMSSSELFMDQHEKIKNHYREFEDLKKDYKSGPIPYFAGLPEEVVPVLFLFPTGRRAQNARQRLLDSPPERYTAFEKRMAQYKVPTGNLFCFAGLDSLLPDGIEGPGRTLEASYFSMEPDADGTTLAGIARVLLIRRKPERRF